ncbi:MAG: ABC transporter substrate-binding protein [Candidatus Omnitrophica bacterium]|nr:ABC transporter substrate-binding protein [Candidatus Omnitrophota bacterium]
MKHRNKNIFIRTTVIKKLLISLVVFLCSVQVALAQDTVSDKYGGQLVFTTTSDPRSFNPVVAKENSTSAVIGYLFEGLTKTDGATLEVLPSLAKSWQVSDNGLVWTFYLREDVLWSDGVPFSADDVVFTFNELIYNDEIPTSSRDIFTIDGKKFEVKRISDHVVQFTLPMRFAPFLRSMGTSIMPKHALKSAVDDKTFSFTWGIDTPVDQIIGTGPYLLSLYQPGQRVVLKANPLYWGKSSEGERLPFIQRIIYLIVQNQDVALLKFLEGETDSCDVRGTDYPLLKPLEKEKNFTVYDLGATFGSNFIVFNQNPRVNPKTNKPFVDPIKLSWFQNLEFRKAVAHAIDKKRIVQIVMNDLGYPQYSAMNPSAGIFYNPNVLKYDYDLEKAKQILADAGFVDRNKDGIREDKDGNKVEFNLFTSSNSAERLQIAAIIRHDLEKIGLKVNFLGLEFNNLVAKLIGAYDWDAILIGLTGGIEPHFGKNVWVSNGQLHFWNPGQEQPQTQWEARVDEIFNLAVQELDDKARKPLYDEWQMIVSRELPLIYTVLGAGISAVRNKFENLNPTVYGGVFHNLEELYIKKKYR